MQQERKPSLLRWVALAVFASVSCTQCIVWFTFSASAPSFFETFFGISRSELDLLLNYGPIVYLPVAPFVAWLLTCRNGLRKTVLFGAVLVCLGACVRIGPCVVSAPKRFALPSRVWLHVGQALNAAAGPVAMSPVSLLSAKWFPTREQTTATSIAFLSNVGGMAVGFLAGPALVRTAAEAPRFIYFEAGLGVLVLVLSIFFFPNDRSEDEEEVEDRPPSPPPLSVQATADEQTPLQQQRPSQQQKQSFVRGLLACLKDPSVMLAVLAAGIQSGIYSSWTGLLQQILEPLNYTPAQAGWFGFCSTAGTVVGALLIGFVADRWFAPRRRMKAMLLVIWAACVLLFLWFTLSLPSPMSAKPLIPSVTATIGISVGAGGLFQGAIDPPLYELAAEASFPVHESTSASLTTFIWNLATLIMLFVAPHIRVELYNTMLTCSFAFCMLLTLVMREKYKRRDAKTKVANESLPAPSSSIADAATTSV